MANFAPVPTISAVPQGPLAGAGSDLRLRPGQGTIGTAAQQSFPRAPWNPAGGSLAGGVFGSGGPRIVDAGGGDGSVDPQTTGSIGGGNNLPTLDALLARQKELAGEQNQMGEMISPWQGVAYAADKFMSGLERGRVDRQETEQRQHLAEIMGGPIGPEQIAQAFAISPEIGIHLLDLEAKKGTEKPQDNWVDMPTPKGENGRWQRNAANGETRRVGSGDLEGGAGVPKNTDISTWRAQVLGDETYVTARKVLPIYQSMLDAANDTTGPNGGPGKISDLALVYGVATMLDPGSVVKEGEQIMVKNAQSLPDWVLGSIAAYNGGKELQDPVRKQILSLGYNKASGVLGAYNQFADWYRKSAERNGFVADDVAPTFGEVKPWAGRAKKPAEIIED